MKKYSAFPCIAFILLQISCSSLQPEIYVSVNGNDENPGTKKMPFLTLQKAQSAVRELHDEQKNITVWIKEGTYTLENTLIFEPEDSGIGSVSYRGMSGENVIISGGKEITGFKKSPDGIWVAPVDMSENEFYDFRELFIDGKRAIRARHPDNGFLRVSEVGADRRTNFRYNANDFPLPADPTEVELVLLHDWSITRINLADIDRLKCIITAKDSIGVKELDFFNIDNWEKSPRYFLENSAAFLDSENEYYFNKKEGLVYLKLKPGESPDGKNIIIPSVTNSLIHLYGTDDNKIKNIHFENISFSYCSWPIPSEGYAGIQACHFDPRGRDKNKWNVVPAAIEAINCENLSFVNCSFLHLGGSGIWLGTGSSNCLIAGCHFEDISGNGVMIGEGNDRIADGDLWWKTAPQQAAFGNKIENSTITGCGRQFFGAVGIWCGLTANTSILNNHIYELPYTGVSIGWLWNPDPTPCRENRIENNHIHHVMQILSDGGGIYSLGLQPGSSIINNHIHDIPLNTGRAESNGMFLDEGTTDVEVSNNLIYNIAKSPLRFHKATKNLVKNNVLSCSGDNPPVRYNNTPVENIILENNQVLQDTNPEHLKILETAISNWNPQSTQRAQKPKPSKI